LRFRSGAHVGPLQQKIRRFYSIKLKLLFNKIEHFSYRFLPVVSTRHNPRQFPLRPYTFYQEDELLSWIASRPRYSSTADEKRAASTALGPRRSGAARVREAAGVTGTSAE
jgi:hypothetical protein